MTSKNSREHDAFVELLPWYVTETLDAEEHAQVAEHILHCTTCQQEIAFYRQINDVEAKAPVWQPSATQFSNIMQNIDALEQNTTAPSAVKATHTPKASKKAPSLWSRFSAWLNTIPGPAMWFMSLETLALAALVMLVVGHLPQQLPGGQLFETLSNDSPAASTNLPRLHIVFAEDMTEREMRTLLQAQQAQLVDGPSLLGVYTVQLATAADNAQQKAIDSLRTTPKIKLVEGITNSGDNEKPHYFSDHNKRPTCYDGL